jgi:hypothetical protein
MREPASDEKTETAGDAREVKRPYVPPAIVWREPYDPISFGVSCAKQPGNPSCGGLGVT